MNVLMRSYDNQIIGLLVNGFISIGLSVAALGLLAVSDKGFRVEAGLLIKKAASFLGRTIRR